MVIDTHTGQNRQIVGAILAVVGDDVVLIAGTAVHADCVVAQETVDRITRNFQRGFVTAYAAYSADEDFAETFSTYVTSTEEEFESIITRAGTDGRNKISQKLRIVKDYFNDNWKLDVDALRNAVQKREANLAEQDFDDISL